jgi:biopolymer transport protein ExbD
MTRINIGSTGEILINNNSIGMFNQAVIDSKIRGFLLQNPKMIFSIKTDRGAKYNEMVRVLDRLKKAGAEKISLSTN